MKKITNVRSNIYDVLENEILEADCSENEKENRLADLLRLRRQETNILLVGATGCGKSSTINALFDMNMAKVGVGVEPETKEIVKYELDNLIVWDTPGLGDDVRKDEEFANIIYQKLLEKNDEGKYLIDLVLVIIDSASKDLGTTYEIINKIIVPCFEDEQDRILIGLNQVDMAMKGKHWNVEENKPDQVLENFLVQKANSISFRIYEATGISIIPVCYSAGYKEDEEGIQYPYNLTKLLYYIVKSLPLEKRIGIANKISKSEKNWLYDDSDEDYKNEIILSFWENVKNSIEDYRWEGEYKGEMYFGEIGKTFGRVLGSATGALVGIFNGLFK